MNSAFFDAIVEQIISLQKANEHITPTVNDIYDVFSTKFPLFKTATNEQYKCVREMIIKFNKLILEKKMSLKEATINILWSIVESCKIL